MKLRVMHGPYKGWYLGRVDDSLVLVKDPREIATLSLVETTTDIEH